MTGLTTTLRKIRDCAPCCAGWKTLLRHLRKTKADDEPITLETILKSNGIDDAIWCLQAVDGYENAMRLYVCFCARLALPIYETAYPDDSRPRVAIETAEQHARGLVSEKDLAAAGAAADSATWEAALAAVGAAARATVGAARAAREAAQAAGAAWDAIRVTEAVSPEARNAQTAEFLRLCRLESEYGEAAR